MIVALLVSAAVNLLVATGILSSPYVSLGLLIAAAGVLVAQLRRQQQLKKIKLKADKLGDMPHTGGAAVLAVWFAVLLGWLATLVYAVFFR